MKQKKLILVKLIGIGNDDKDYNNDDEKSKSNYDEKSKSNYEYEGDDSEYKNNKGSDNENENSVY